SPLRRADRVPRRRRAAAHLSLSGGLRRSRALHAPSRDPSRGGLGLGARRAGAADEGGEAMSETHEGGCMCGRTRFAFTGEPKFIANCHCEPCRRWTGAPMTTYVGARTEQVTWSGAEPAVFHSSPGADRFFCPVCGTALGYRGVRWPGETHLVL